MSRKKPRPTPVPARTILGLIDAHTHLASCKDDAAALVERAGAAGVDKLCTVGDAVSRKRRLRWQLRMLFPRYMQRVRFIRLGQVNWIRLLGPGWWR